MPSSTEEELPLLHPLPIRTGPMADESAAAVTTAGRSNPTAFMSIRAASVLDSEGLLSSASSVVTPAVEKSQPRSQTHFGSGLDHFFTGDYAGAERQLTVAI